MSSIMASIFVRLLSTARYGLCLIGGPVVLILILMLGDNLSSLLLLQIGSHTFSLWLLLLTPLS